MPSIPLEVRTVALGTQKVLNANKVSTLILIFGTLPSVVGISSNMNGKYIVSTGGKGPIEGFNDGAATS